MSGRRRRAAAGDAQGGAEIPGSLLRPVFESGHAFAPARLRTGYCTGWIAQVADASA
jgi:hypothetical protein